METSLQKIIAAIVGILILFIIPVYIAFEKVDDVSYSLVLKLTQNFVDNVRNKGYISPEMYSDFVSGLYATNNTYDVTIEHVKKRQDPAIYIYERVQNDDGTVTKGNVLHVLDYNSYITADNKLPSSITLNMKTYNTEESIVAFEKTVTYTNNVNCIIDKAHITNEEYITDKQIIEHLFENTGITKLEFLRQCMLGNGDMYNSLVYINENSYIMNEGDRINVTVRNKNQTIASVFYSLFTANVGNEEIAKIYVDYGGTIKNSGSTIISSELGSVDSKTGRLFKYTGRVQEITLAPGIYRIECWGASGGYPTNAYTGVTINNNPRICYGSYVSTRFEISEETTLYIYVGGQGSLYSETNVNNGGYNGGGNSYNGYGGGGATDVRLLKGDSDDVSSLLTRIVVAAGGGGFSGKNNQGFGGPGGNLFWAYSGGYSFAMWPIASSESNHEQLKLNLEYSGIGAHVVQSDTRVIGYTDHGISETERGSLGLGGSVDFDGAGAGGGGYYGGSASHNPNAGGGGGISYIRTDANSAGGTNDDEYPISNYLARKYAEYLPSIKHLVDTPSVGTEPHWKGVLSLYNGQAIDAEVTASQGFELMANPLTFTGTYDMYGNKGNGYARIKKVSD